jgi:hypothetical protein
MDKSRRMLWLQKGCSADDDDDDDEDADDEMIISNLGWNTTYPERFLHGFLNSSVQMPG